VPEWLALGSRLGLVEQSRALLDAILQAACAPIERKRASDERKPVRGIRPAALARLHGRSEVEDDDADSHQNHLQVVGEAVVVPLPADEDAEEHHGDHLARLAEHLCRAAYACQGNE